MAEPMEGAKVSGKARWGLGPLNWINLKDLVLIHELVINETGGTYGIITR